MIYTKELPYSFSDVEYALSYDILSRKLGASPQDLKQSTEYTNLMEMTAIVYAYDNLIRDIWEECFNNADILTPSQIEYGQLLDHRSYVTKFTKDRQLFYLLNSFTKDAEPMILRLVWDHLVLQKIRNLEDAIIEPVMDFGFGIYNDKQRKENETGGFVFAKEW